MMKKDESGKYSISFEIENTRIYITLYGGFFNTFGGNNFVHNHNQFELHFLLEGESHLELGTKQILLKASEGCLLAPGVVHNWKEANQKAIQSSFCFAFEEAKRKTSHDTYSLFCRAFENIQNFKKIENTEKYLSDLKRILSEFYSKKPLTQHKIKHCFALILSTLVEDLLPNTQVPEKDSRESPLTADTEKNLRRIMIEEYMNRNYDKSLSLKDLATILHLSEKQTERIFEKEFQMGFRAYIMKFRLNVATHLLDQTDLSVTEIASKVGYKSYNGFYKLFLAQMKQSPEAFRTRKKR